MTGAGGTAKSGGLARAAFPLYLSMIASTAGALVDVALLGRHGTASLAAFAVAVAVFGPATATVAGALRGLMPFVAQQQDDPKSLHSTVRSGMWLGWVSGTVCAVPVVLVPLIGRLSGVPARTLEVLGAFPLLLAASVVAVGVGSSASSVLVALGHSALVMRGGLAGTASSVVLSVLLVGAPGLLPGLGLTGAGLAMLGSHVVSAGINQALLRRRLAPAGRPPWRGRPELPLMWRLSAVGIPLAGTVLVKFSVLGVLTFAAARIGTPDAAVHSVCLSLVNLLFTVAVAVGQAVVPLVAERAAARDTTGVVRVARSGTLMAAGAVCVLWAGLFVLRGPALPLFSEDAALHTRIAAMLPLVLAVAVTDALQAVPGFALIGLKRTGVSFLWTCAAFAPLAALAVPVGDAGGLTALWWALALANTGQAVAKTVSLLREGRRPGPQTGARPANPRLMSGRPSRPA